MSKFKEWSLKHLPGRFNVIEPSISRGFSEDTYFREWGTGKPIRISEITKEHCLVGTSIDSRVVPVRVSVLARGGQVRMRRHIFFDEHVMTFGELKGAEVHCTQDCVLMFQDEAVLSPGYTCTCDTEFGSLKGKEKSWPKAWAPVYTKKYKQVEFPRARTLYRFCQAPELSPRACWSFDTVPVAGAPVDFVLLSNGLFVSCF